MIGFLNFFSNSESQSFIKKREKITQQVRAHIETYQNLDRESLKAKTEEFKKRVAGGETLDSILPEAFAAVCVASERTTGLAPYDVQILGGVALHEHAIAEMRTGEGKTLVAVMPAYLNTLTGESVHIITVNDYLARRDAVWMGQIYAALGVSVGVINGEEVSYHYDPGHKEKDAERDEKGGYKIVYDFLRETSRKEAYQADVVYGTNNEFAFDYLRDNIAYKKEDVRQRGFHYAIVDEVDSILIDEARSPLIISSPANIPPSHYMQFTRIAEGFEIGEDYEVDEKARSVSLLPSGIGKLEKALGIENAFVEGGQMTIHHLQNALKAKALFTRDKQYVIQNGAIMIVDEFTGRLQPGRQWSEGLHQAIEAKEGVEIHQENRTYASITFQNFFRMYTKLAGMTGTAKSSEEEFYKVYGVTVISIPTHNPTQRIDHRDIIFQTKEAKLGAVVKKIDELHKKKQPVLVGTVSIEHNEELSNLLQKAKIPHQVLNAKNHEREGDIISAAGEKGAVTIATNLAGRGVDIKLGGAQVKDREEGEEVRKLGGLFVLGTERHESRRIDDQLRGRCGRQGDQGETQFFLSLQDDLTRVFGSDRVVGVAKKMGLPEDQAIQNNFISKSIEGAQKRIEGHHFDARRFNLQYDTILNKHRSEIYAKRLKVLQTEGEEGITQFIPSEKIETIKNIYQDNWLEKLQVTVLRSIDLSWIDHLALMDHARSSTGLRSYGQKEPLMEYKKEAHRLFSNFWEVVGEQIETEVKNLIEKGGESSNT